MTVYRLEEMSTPALDALDRDQTVILLTVSPLEEHGPHLPVGVDAFAARHFAETIAERVVAGRPGWSAVLVSMSEGLTDGICIENGEKPMRRAPSSAAAPDSLGAAVPPPLQAVSEMPTARVSAAAKGRRTVRAGLWGRDMALHLCVAIGRAPSCCSRFYQQFRQLKSTFAE